MATCPSLLELYEASGINFEVVMYDGVLIPKLMIENVKTMKSRSSRPDDIYLCTYPKSGTHWVWEILNMIVAGKAEYAKHWQNSSWLENRTEKDLEELDSPRVLRTHLLPRMLPDSVWQRKCKIVYVQRNIKDVIVSAYHQVSNQVWKDNPVQDVIYAGTWEDIVELFLTEVAHYASWFDHVASWHNVTALHKDIEICFVKYEDMIEDCAREIKKMAEYLERPLPDEIYNGIAAACSFHKLKHVSENEKDQTFHNKFKEGSEGYFRKGVVGDWKNWFTVAQSEKVDRLYEERMKEKFPY